MRGLFHFADLAKLSEDCKIPLSKGLGAANIGT